ncbi:cytochrome b5-like [Belonocnema kinseyi]|uniref:cytochrome b5-like n=1 Tax=Belonocnema kinseyi TaxID=2817044 RepID=UPI00143DBA30|nr:cytochrome b5-like [Belonocnema kinseyi]
MNLYRLEDVAKHNGENGTRIWVLIQNSVYDLTDYMEEHPGGDDLIREFAGKNGTKGFNDIGHSSDAKNLMKKFKIGELDEVDFEETLVVNVKK